jgi:DNA-binding response OmpR family regulator
MKPAPSKKILIIEDEPDVVDLLTLQLRKGGEFTASVAADGVTGVRKAREEAPALIILDLMLPKMSGLEVCKILKTDSGTRHIPIMMLTAKAEEIVLRIKAIMRRQTGDSAEETLTSGSIAVDPARHHVTVSGKPVRLTSVEFKLLTMLLRRPGRVQTRDRLLNEVWGYESLIDTRTVDTHVRRLREKLGKAAKAIETVRGFGYRLREE